MKKLIIAVLSIGVLSAPSFAQLDRSKVPTAKPNPEIKINIPDAMTFDNGLKVIMVENHKLPKVSFQLYVDYPAPLEGDKAGLSSLFGEMIGSGTKSTPKDDFDQQIDYIGADFFSNSRGFYASSLKKHTPSMLKLIQEVLTEPAFAQEDFDRIVSQNKSNLASIASDANAISSNIEGVVNFGMDHPYGEVMTEKTLANITLADMKEFYDKNFIPNQAYLVVVGDVTSDDVKNYVKKYFEPWQKGTPAKKKNYEVPTNDGNQVYFVDKPGAVQSVINITHNVALTPGHPDEIKLRLMNAILGGGSFSARLMSNLREDKAYTYGAYSQMNSDPLMGYFSAGGSFRNEVTDSAIVQLLAEIEVMTESEVTDKEIDLVKKSMTGAFARSLESPQTIARFALNTVRYNLPNDYYATYLLRLERITKADILMVAEQYLKPNNLNIVVVGNEDIAKKLEKFDSDGKIGYKNYFGKDIENLKEVADGVTAESIFNQYAMNVMMVESKEEMDAKLAGIGQVEQVSQAEIEEYNVTIISYNAEGKDGQTASYTYVKSPMGNQVQQSEWFDGEKGEQTAMGKTEAYTAEEIETKKNTTFPISQMGFASDPNKTITLLGIAEIDDKDYYKIKIVDPTGDEDLTLEYYDVATGLLMMREIVITDDEENTSTTIIKLSDYKEKSEMMIPMITEINTQGQVITLHNKMVKVGKKAKSKAFSGNYKKAKKLILSM